MDTDRNAARGTLMLCRFCWEEEHGASLSRISELATQQNVTVQMVDCMAACDTGPSAAILAPGSWTYLLGQISGGEEEMLVWGAAAMARSEDGLLPWEGRPKRYREIIRGRIPPLATRE